ncbi:UPF0481 protein At3g47200-like [Rutidosis leptorrhynchoides]|uniref:UPF0481 protein At3g47200-like n=1 Tax=Rutidosis leptorrhynchoides TaxID=125765 RepID=UPI003A99495D
MSSETSDGRSVTIYDQLADDRLATQIEKSFEELIYPTSSECSIFKVPVQQGCENKEAYEPRMLAIGPYHIGKDRLQAMEVHKKIYFKLLLDRTGMNLATLIYPMRILEKRACESYAEPVSFHSDQFVKMMLLDGCFILELMRKNFFKHVIEENDVIFKELQVAGIDFKKSESHNLFEITFQNGVLEIPEILIDNRTETFFRNLIAYEQCSLYEIPIYVFDCIIVMDRLIKSEKDVELLRGQGIINNTLGNYEVLSKMFNKVNVHCNKRWNFWKAKLRHNYCNSPWALISVIAAAIILLLTFTQTDYSVLSYYHHKFQMNERLIVAVVVGGGGGTGGEDEGVEGYGGIRGEIKIDEVDVDEDWDGEGEER